MSGFFCQAVMKGLFAAYLLSSEAIGELGGCVWGGCQSEIEPKHPQKSFGWVWLMEPLTAKTRGWRCSPGLPQICSRLVAKGTRGLESPSV